MILMLQECLKFLKGIHYGGSQDFSTKPFYPSNALSNVYLDTASTFLKVLWKNSSTFTTKFVSLQGSQCCVVHMSNGIVWLT